MKNLSLWNYAFEALLINELHEVDILIDPIELPPLPGKGDFILGELAMDYRMFYFDIFIMCGYAVLCIVFAAILLRFFVKEKR